MVDQVQPAVSTMAKLAQDATPAVVRIGGGWRGGCGIVIADGLVLTNAHNVRGESVSVGFFDGRTARAEVAAMDADGDLAVLRVETSAITPLSWADATPTIGASIYVVAPAPEGPRVTAGHISSVARGFRGPRGRRISGSLEHTAPMAPGSSGSPVLGADGRIVGLNTNRLGDGFYLALPTSPRLREQVDGLSRGESVERPRLGIGIAPGHVARRLRRAVGLSERAGLLVRDVEEGSAAERAGVAQGDLLVSASGKELASADDLYDAIAGAARTGKLELSVVRGSDERTVTVDLTVRAEHSAEES